MPEFSTISGTRLANSGSRRLEKRIGVGATRQIEHAAAARIRRIGAGDACQPHAQKILAGQRPAGPANDVRFVWGKPDKLHECLATPYLWPVIASIRSAVPSRSNRIDNALSPMVD